jgi:hypothetical protein
MSNREPRIMWERRVARWAKSGLSREEFAAREGVKPGTLGWWRWFLSSRPSSALVKRSPAFVEVEPVVVDVIAERIEVALPNGRVVRVPGAFDDAALRRVLAIAEGP